MKTWALVEIAHCLRRRFPTLRPEIWECNLNKIIVRLCIAGSAKLCAAFDLNFRTFLAPRIHFSYWPLDLVSTEKTPYLEVSSLFPAKYIEKSAEISRFFY